MLTSDSCSLSCNITSIIILTGFEVKKYILTGHIITNCFILMYLWGVLNVGVVEKSGSFFKILLPRERKPTFCRN